MHSRLESNCFIKRVGAIRRRQLLRLGNNFRFAVNQELTGAVQCGLRIPSELWEGKEWNKPEVRKDFERSETRQRRSQP